VAKGTSPDEVTLNSAKIKPIAVVVIKLRLSESISKLVSQSVRQSENLTKFLNSVVAFWN